MSGPTVSVGLPVRNGERFLQGAAEAILAQTWTDLELIICDADSTDGTPAIARRLAEADRRVRVVDGVVAGGIPANFMAAYRASRGRYFKWAADDDIHRPTFVERCVEVLEADPGVVVAWSRARSVDDTGRVLRPDWGDDRDLGSVDPVARFAAAMSPLRDPIPLPIFGLMRRDALEATGLLAPVPEFDLALLAELALHGRLVQIDEVLFDQMEHRGRSGPALAADSRGSAPATGHAGRLPHWGLARRHLESVARAPAGVSKARLLRIVGRWALAQRGELGRDLAGAAATLPLVGPSVRRAVGDVEHRRWQRQVRLLRQEVDRRLAADARLVLVDADELGLGDIGGRPCDPLQPMDSPDGSIPATGPQTVAALTERRSQGATHLVVAFTAAWVLDYHRDLADHLAADHRLVAETAGSRIYELAPLAGS